LPQPRRYGAVIARSAVCDGLPRYGDATVRSAVAYGPLITEPRPSKALCPSGRQPRLWRSAVWDGRVTEPRLWRSAVCYGSTAATVKSAVCYGPPRYRAATV